MIGSSENVGSIAYDARIDTSNLKTDALKADRIVKGTGNSISNNLATSSRKAGTELKKLGRVAAVAFAASAAAVVTFGIKSVKAYQDSEEKLAQLNTVLKSTKGIAGVTSDAAIELSKSLQLATRFSDEEVLSAENLLLTFTKIGKDIFPKATETILDMATALGEDTKSASIQLGKALQDPILGITALRRVGVNFNDAQKKVIANLVKTGKTAEAQRLILKELHTEFGGSARAAGDTFAGSIDKLKNQFNDLQETIGKAIIDAILPYAKSIAKYLHNAGPQLAENIQHLIKSFVNLSVFVGKHITLILSLIAAYKSLKLTMALVGVARSLTSVLTASTAASTAIGGVSTAMTGATGAASLLSLGWGALAVVAAAGIGFGVYKLIQHFKNSVVAMGEVKKGTDTLTGAWKIEKLFVEANVTAHKNLVQAKKDLKVAIDNNKTSQNAFAKAVADSHTPEQKLFDLEHKAIADSLALAGARGKLATNTQAAADAHKNLLNWEKTWKKFADGSLGSIAKLSTNMGRLATNTLQVAGALNVLQGQPKDIQRQFQNAIPKALLQGTNLDLQGGSVPLQGSRKKASGGPVSAGTLYQVNEKGPELFVPNVSGEIISNKDMKSAKSNSISIMLNMSGIMARSRSDLRYIARDMIESVNEALRAKGQPEIGGGMI